MSDMMDFPKTVEEFMEMYKMVDADEVYSNGTEYVPIYRMKQWFEHQRTSNAHPTHECVNSTNKCVEMINREDAIIAVRKHRIDIDSPHKIVKKTYEDVIRDLPFELVGNSDQLNRTCANCKHYTEEHLCVFWSYFGFEPNDCCSRWEERDD